MQLNVRSYYGAALITLDINTISHYSIDMPKPREFTSPFDRDNIKKVLYSAIFLTEKSKQKLLGWYAPMFPNVKAHHITLAFKSGDVGPFTIGQKVTLRITGQGADSKCQAVVINVLGYPTALWYRGESCPHITISHTDEVTPVYSNELLNHSFTHVPSLELEGVVGVFGTPKS